jgi:anaerobic magnesium-protoporphyrin IX monomethyl ester cyclase
MNIIDNKKDNYQGRVILVNPGIYGIMPYNYNEIGMYPNNAIQILGTILHQDMFDVKIVDGRYVSVENAVEQISALADNDLIFVGFSIMTVQVKWAYLVSCGIKERNSNIKVVWGGVHPSLFPEQTVSDKHIDICVVNDCASTVSKIAYSLKNKTDISMVPGLCYKNGDKIIRTQPNLINDDFTNIPFIDFTIMNHKVYSRNNNVATNSSLNNESKDYIVYPINTALGCGFRCNFCINVIIKKKYKMRSAEEIVDRIMFLQKEFGANFIHLNDENFFGSKKRTYQFVELILRNDIKIKWRPSVRANYFNKNFINESFVRELEKSGMVIAVMGAESASQKTLDRLKKGLKVEDIHRAVEILSKTKIIPRMSFMVGLPDETEEDIKETYRLVVELKEKYPTFQAVVCPFRSYPGSELYDLTINKYGYKPPESLIDWIKLDDTEFSESMGYQNFDNYDWITDKKVFRLRNNVHSIYWATAWKVSPLVVNKGLKAKLKYFMIYLLYQLSKMRLKKGFYSLNVEQKLLELFKKRL